MGKGWITLVEWAEDGPKVIFLITAVQQLVPNELASNTFLTNHLQCVPTDEVQNKEIFFRN